MATRKRITLDSWIRDAMTEEKDAEGGKGTRKCSMLALVHMVGSQQKEVHAVKFGSGKSWQPEELANLFRGKAEGFSQDLSGTQTFQLLAFYGQGEAETAHPFTVAPMLSPDNLLPSEPATSEGRMGQLMRQAEMTFQQTYRKQQHLDEMSMRFIEILSNNNAKLMTENMGAFSAMKELLMEQALNTHKHVMEQQSFQRTSDERKKWISYIPMLANTVLGREIFPQSSADTVLMEQIVENIDENAIMALAQFVKPELMGPLMERFTQISAKKRLETEARQKALVPVTSGEQDVSE